MAAAAKDAVVFTYEGQRVYYTANNPWVEQAQQPTTAPRAPTTAPTPTTTPAPTLPRVNRNFFTLGFPGFEGKDSDWLTQGPLYGAFVGNEQIVVANNLSSMARALDVLAGRRPSLAKVDPQGLKADAPPGTYLSGVGLTAAFGAGDGAADAAATAGATTKPAGKTAGAVSSELGPGVQLALFGSLKGKARLARFDAGEDEQSLFVDATFSMTDEAAAQQLKNLALGVRALVSFSQAEQKRLAEPIDIQVAGKDVMLRWHWPVGDCPELLRLTSGTPAATAPTAATKSVR